MKKINKALSFLLVLIMLITPVSITAQAATASQMKSKVISIAQAEVGYVGSGSYSKYGEWYGYQGAWCTTFVLWCFNKAGNSLGVKLYGKVTPSGGNCNSMISWYKNKGRYHTRTSGYTPKKGDLVFFDWSGNGSAQHVGIVKSTSGSTVYTIEGNCSGKVKAKTYTTSGSRPYGNVSSILGYGNPNWESVSGEPATTEKKTTTKKATTTKKRTTTKKKTTTTKKKTTTKKRTTTKKSKNKATTKKSTTKKATTTKKGEKTTTTTTVKADESTTAQSESQTVEVSNMKLYASATDLQVGDTVELDYTVEPANAQAVVQYFCDEENIIEISDGGKITATGEGTATVVVCANDEVYKQCDFKVTAAKSAVTKQSNDKSNIIATTTPTTAIKTNDVKLKEMGVNVEKLESHKQNYLVPICIIATTAAICVMILAIKKVNKYVKNKKSKSE